MVKNCNCLVKISTGPNCSDMTYVEDWYVHGRLADGFSWAKTIKPGHEELNGVLSYERDGSWVGCSGYVTYKLFDTDITIAFSNPSVGTNKLGVGTGGKAVWDNMNNENYNWFTVNVVAKNGEVNVQLDCRCTTGSINTCTVNITAYKK